MFQRLIKYKGNNAPDQMVNKHFKSFSQPPANGHSRSINNYAQASKPTSLFFAAFPLNSDSLDLATHQPWEDLPFKIEL